MKKKKACMNKQERVMIMITKEQGKVSQKPSFEVQCVIHKHCSLVDQAPSMTTGQGK